jgi:S1-C subfamily serine protease
MKKRLRRMGRIRRMKTTGTMRTSLRISFALIVLAAMIPRPARAQQASRGWVGVAYTTGIGTTDRNGAMIFTDYPVIESIEPNSPAERAGLLAGDTILAMNAQDLRKSPLPDATMVQPGKKIVVRFRRNALREVTVTVAPRPSGTSETVALTIIGPTPSPSQAPSPGSRVLLRAPRGASEVAARAAVPQTPALPPLAFGFGPRTLALAGAELTGLNADLGALAGVDLPGIFVVNVAPGTPAKESGLRSGDVIVKAASSPVGDPGELIRVLRRANGSSLRLDIIRKRRPQTITLRW